jgi:MATE family multidrug resistance protein
MSPSQDQSEMRARAVRRSLSSELRPTLALAWPVILAELGWMGMGLADMFMVGRLGPEAIGAVGLGNILYFTVSIVGYGLLLGLDTEVSQAFGAGRLDDCRRWLLHGCVLAVILSPPLIACVWLFQPLLNSWGIAPEVLERLHPYLRVMNWTTPPLLFYVALRRYLQGMNVVRSVMFSLISANVVNIAGNWVLVYGNLGSPRLDVEGSAWATFIARVYMVLVLAWAVVWHDRGCLSAWRRITVRVEWPRIRRLLALGVPAAAQLLLEIGVFAVAATLAGRLGPAALATHEIVLNVCGLTFMVPLGIASAGTVRVGQAIGRGDPDGAAAEGWAALAVGAGFMACAAAVFLMAPRTIVGAFTTDRMVITTGITLLAVAAAFQLFDGLQVVATGLLRGVGDTKTPMIGNLLAHWCLGLPIGFCLAFLRGWGVLGIWIGLSAGLIAVGMFLLRAWSVRSRRLRRGDGPESHGGVGPPQRTALQWLKVSATPRPPAPQAIAGRRYSSRARPRGVIHRPRRADRPVSFAPRCRAACARAPTVGRR